MTNAFRSQEINTKLEAHATQHVEMAEKNAVAHEALAKQVEDQTKGVNGACAVAVGGFFVSS